MSLETLKPKVAKLIEKAKSGARESTGIILSDFTGSYQQPKKADMRSLVITESAQQYFNNIFSGLFSNSNGNGNGGYYVLLEEVYLPENMTVFSGSMFSYCGSLTTLHGDFSKVRFIDGYAFRNCKKLPQIPFCPNLRTIGTQAFASCTGLTEATFPSTITSIANNAFNGCTNLLDIYVPWAEGAIANAPWGATNATIHYNSEV